MEHLSTTIFPCLTRRFTLSETSMGTFHENILDPEAIWTTATTLSGTPAQPHTSINIQPTNHVAATDLIYACKQIQHDLLKFKGNSSMGKEGDFKQLEPVFFYKLLGFQKITTIH